MSDLLQLLAELPAEERAYWLEQLEMGARGERPAIYKLIELCENNTWHSEKLFWLQQLGDEAEAQYALANHYFMEGDEERAFYYYEKAALQHHADAANNLADMYLNGEGVATNEQLAFHWFMKAAEAGVVEAMFTLGIMYEQGLGQEVNEVSALHYYISSANGRYVEAQYQVGMIYLEGLLGQQQNLQKAIIFFEMAAQQHHVDALFNLGYIFAEPQYRMQDGVKAMHYFKRAALLGDTSAKWQLVQHYENGVLVERNKDEAQKWKQSINQKLQ